MTQFADRVGLRDPERDGLEPDPERDWALYVDLDQLETPALARLASRAPKLVVYGDYGTGKTHFLHVLINRVDGERFVPVYVKLEPYGRVAESRHLHRQIVLALEARHLLMPCIEGALADGFSLPMEADLRHAFEKLRENPRHPEVRSWLLAEGPTQTQARKHGFAGPLYLLTRAVGYAGIWKILGTGYRERTQRELLFFIDESETFQDIVDPTRATDLGVGIREMVDPTNKAYGVVFGLTAPKGRQALHPLIRPDVSSRIAGARLDLEGLHSPDRRRQFITELLGNLLWHIDSFLSPDAVNVLVERGSQGINIGFEFYDRDLVQRDLVRFFQFLALLAIQHKIELPITADALTGGRA